MSTGKKSARHESDARRRIASVSRILEESAVNDMIAEYTRDVVTDTVRDVLEAVRKSAASTEHVPDIGEIVERVASSLSAGDFERIRPIVNATGIILHTGLGRAVLPSRAAEALGRLDRCCNLQIDLESGKRGKRSYVTERLLARLTGAEAALVVNNNAAATLLVLSSLCKGREVIVSRGQLIEIGGSYRLPDCITQSGAVMVEVGTTNKTHLYDYERAVTDNTGMILRVNPSNYRIVGFSEQVSISDLVSLKRTRQVIVADDLGCGALVDLSRYGLPKEPTVRESIAAGADLAFFSGDKLIGGPQAGIIVGRKSLVDIIRKHPLTRMLRICKLTDTALEQTLRLFLDPERLAERHPTLRMLTQPADTLRTRAKAMKTAIDAAKPALSVRVAACDSETGGGSMPGTNIPSYGIAIRSVRINAGELSRLLRHNEPPIVARVAGDEVLIDMRTLLDGDDGIVRDAIITIGKETT